MKYLAEAVSRARNIDPSSVVSVKKPSSEDELYQQALAKAKAKLNIQEADEYGLPATVDATDKGMFGGRQVRFKEEVYKIPETPAGDASQPVGILTKADLNNYTLFRKDDRLSFKYKEGTAGACCYTATRSGSGEEVDCCDWTDGLIQELIDEGAIELV